MSSLKNFLPNLEAPLGADAVALYERQRVLMGGNILAASPGRGPGSGAQLSAKNLAIFVISVMASDTLFDTHLVTPLFLNLTPAGHEKCPMTGARKFVDAVATVLSSEDTLNSVGDLVIERQKVRATLMNATNEEGIRFLDRRYKHPINGYFTSVTLPNRNLKKIATAYLKLANA